MSLRLATKSLADRLRALHTTTTTPRSAPYAATAELGNDARPRPKPKGMYVPVYVALGMIVLSVTLGIHTAKKQLMHSPTVRVKKSRRETVPELVEPDRVVEESENFLTRGFFRRVAHVQDFGRGESIKPDPIRKGMYAHNSKAVTLKSAGVDPEA